LKNLITPSGNGRVNMKAKLHTIFTIGVYGRSEDEFFNLLTDNGINLLIDVRRRRGMRGKKYSFVNSNYLQKKLTDLEIEYLHEKDLSPTEEIRKVQKDEDKLLREQKRKRVKLSGAFLELYRNSVLSEVGLDGMLERITELTKVEQIKLCLFCVEAEPQACHRWMIADELMEKAGGVIQHL